MAETTTIYVTKGAETHGIRKVEAEIDEGGHSAREIGPDGRHRSLRDRSFWHTEFETDEAAAVAKAEDRRAKRLVSLKKQIAAMEAIDLTKVREG